MALCLLSRIGRAYSFHRQLSRACHADSKQWGGACGHDANTNTLQPVLISIEGNIGAGKTSLLERLGNKHPEWIFISEPVDTWSSIVNDEGKSILQVFYEDRKRWSYTFQNCALLTRYQCIESAIERAKVANRTGKVVFLTERCLDTDYHVFTKMLMSEGSIDKLEHNLYERLLSQLRTTATPLSAIVHVNTIPTVCAERIKKRSRIGEGNIPLTYLESLNKYQREWIESSTVPSISSDCDFVDISIIESFIENLQT